MAHYPHYLCFLRRSERYARIFVSRHNWQPAYACVAPFRKRMREPKSGMVQKLYVVVFFAVKPRQFRKLILTLRIVCGMRAFCGVEARAHRKKHGHKEIIRGL